MSRYVGRHRSCSEADTDEIDRILGITEAPLRTIEEIAAGPSWVRPLTEHGTYNPVPPPPKLTSFAGPPVWRLRDWMAWTMSWRAHEQEHENSYRLV